MLPTKTRVALISLGGVALIALLFGPYIQARLRPLWSPAPIAEVEDQEIGEPNQLFIPSLGITAPIVYPTDSSEEAYQTALRDGVAHYPGTPNPGEAGNVYIFGHSSDYLWAPGDYKTIFAMLPEIQVGAEIQITDSEGKLFRYEVTETKIVGPRDRSVLDQFQYQKKMLTLQTSYPLGTALQRFIVVSELK